ncbi:hypothetical protein ACFFWB_26675 [Flavobacterium procerum]|uniref:hypothetical protein n=1 Tax=Flavobacterium procerum TaxID=1455569 RepID=UPI0035E4D79E
MQKDYPLFNLKIPLGWENAYGINELLDPKKIFAFETLYQLKFINKKIFEAKKKK